MAQLSFLAYLRGIYQIRLRDSSEHRVHYALIKSIYDIFIMAQGDLNEMRLEMCLKTATGKWLDYWGDYFGIYRKALESDDHYSQRIIDSIIQPKATIPAIKDNIVNYLNSEKGTNYTREDVDIREPWKEVAKYSHKGTLSNDARFFSGDYYTHAVIEISIPEVVTQEIIDLANAVKAAGVKIIWSTLNSYDLITGFNTADDAWASYHRWIQTRTENNQFSGLILSNSSPNPVLSGSREIWFWMTNAYWWYAKIQDHNTDRSVTVSKYDLLNLLDVYTEIDEVIQQVKHEAFAVDTDTGELSGDNPISGEELQYDYVERFVKVTQEMLDSLALLDDFLSLSKTGRMSTSEGVLVYHTAEDDLFNKLLAELEKFKAEHRHYYDSVQSYILNGERVMWYVQRNKNWIWNTPALTLEDFYELWDDFDDEHTLEDIVSFSDTFENNYIEFGDKYQPPIVVGDKQTWAASPYYPWLWKSPVFTHDDLKEIFRRQFKDVFPSPEPPATNMDYPNPTLYDLKRVERHNYERYSIRGQVQPPIIIHEGELRYNTDVIPYRDLWLFSASMWRKTDLASIYQQDSDQPLSLKDLTELDTNVANKYVGGAYSVKGNVQGEIEIHSESIE